MPYKTRESKHKLKFAHSREMLCSRGIDAVIACKLEIGSFMNSPEPIDSGAVNLGSLLK